MARTDFGAARWGPISGSAAEITGESPLAISTRTSPWQGLGWHQHPSTFPRSSRRAAATSSGCSVRYCRYFPITVDLSPSRPISNGLPHFDGRPM